MGKWKNKVWLCLVLVKGLTAFGQSHQSSCSTIPVYLANGSATPIVVRIPEGSTDTMTFDLLKSHVKPESLRKLINRWGSRVTLREEQQDLYTLSLDLGSSTHQWGQKGLRKNNTCDLDNSRLMPVDVDDYVYALTYQTPATLTAKQHPYEKTPYTLHWTVCFSPSEIFDYEAGLVTRPNTVFYASSPGTQYTWRAWVCEVYLQPDKD